MDQLTHGKVRNLDIVMFGTFCQLFESKASFIRCGLYALLLQQALEDILLMVA